MKARETIAKAIDTWGGSCRHYIDGVECVQPWAYTHADHAIAALEQAGFRIVKRRGASNTVSAKDGQ